MLRSKELWSADFESGCGGDRPLHLPLSLGCCPHFLYIVNSRPQIFSPHLAPQTVKPKPKSLGTETLSPRCQEWHFPEEDHFRPGIPETMDLPIYRAYVLEFGLGFRFQG